jgi:hypothetical protein
MVVTNRPPARTQQRFAGEQARQDLLGGQIAGAVPNMGGKLLRASRAESLTGGHFMAGVSAGWPCPAVTLYSASSISFSKSRPPSHVSGDLEQKAFQLLRLQSGCGHADLEKPQMPPAPRFGTPEAGRQVMLNG